jgi:hypothetical protein
MQFVPSDFTKFVIATDGGIFLSENIDTVRGKPSYRNLNNNYNVTQFYSCAMHPEAGSNYYLAGSQDNGTQGFFYEGINSTERIRGGDGGFCHIDQLDPDIQIASFIYSDYSITGTNWNSFWRIKLGNKSGKFINPTDYDSETKRLYCSYDADTLVRIDEIGTKNKVNMIPLALDSGEISAVLVHPTINNQVWIGASRTFYKDKDISKGRPIILKIDSAHSENPVISDLSIPGLSLAVYIRSIDASIMTPDRILVTLSNYGVNSVWLTNNGGITWENKEGDLPDIPIRWGIFNPKNDRSVLLGTELGVLLTDDISSTSVKWKSGNEKLANTRVDMLQYRSSDNQIAAATHGRGLFTTNSLNKTNIHFAVEEFIYQESSISGISNDCMDPTDTVLIPILLSEPQIDTTYVKFSIEGESELNQDFFIDSTLKINPGIITGWMMLIINNDQLQEIDENTQITMSFDETKFGSSNNSFILTLEDDEKNPYLIPEATSKEHDFSAQQLIPENSIWYFSPQENVFKFSITSVQSLGCMKVEHSTPSNPETVKKALKGYAVGEKWTRVKPEEEHKKYGLEIYYSAKEISKFQTPLENLNLVKSHTFSESIDTAELEILKDVERIQVNDSMYAFIIQTIGNGSFTLTNSPSLDSISTKVVANKVDITHSIYPNPSFGELIVNFEEKRIDNFSVKLLSLSGAEIPITYSQSILNNLNITIINKHYGLAILQFYSENRIIGYGKVLILKN